MGDRIKCLRVLLLLGHCTFLASVPKSCLLVIWLDQGAATTQCMDLDYDHNMDELLANTRQVYIIMPAKAAGTSSQSDILKEKWFPIKILKKLDFLEAQKRGKFIVFPFIKCLILSMKKIPKALNI